MTNFNREDTPKQKLFEVLNNFYEHTGVLRLTNLRTVSWTHIQYVLPLNPKTPHLSISFLSEFSNSSQFTCTTEIIGMSLCP